MANLNITHTMVPGDLARADDVNDNFGDILAWTLAGQSGTVASGIQNDNFGIMTGFVKWQMVDDDQAIKISSTSNLGTILVEQTGAMLDDQASLYLHDTAAETNDSAVAHIHLDNASASAAALKVTHTGTGKAITVSDGSSANFEVNPAGAIDGRSLGLTHDIFVGTDAQINGNLDVNGAGPHTIDNNLDVGSCDVAGLLTCDTINATSATGTSTFTNDVDVLGTLTAATLSLTNLFVDNAIYVGSAPQVVLSKSTTNMLQVNDKVKLGSSGPSIGPEKIGDSNSTGIAILSSSAAKNEVVVTSDNIPGSYHLRIIRGTVRMDGFPTYVWEGEGWSGSPAGIGEVSISFSVPFAATPVCVVGGGENNSTPIAVGMSSTGFGIQGNTGADSYTHFIVIGLSA